MTTLQSLTDAGSIIKIDLGSDNGASNWRILYGTPKFIDWLNQRIESDEPSPRGLDLSLSEQLDALFYAYLSGQTLVHSQQFKLLAPNENNVWELKTGDLRIFGWFLQKDCFLCVFGELADKVKGRGEWAAFGSLYPGFRNEVVRIRAEMGCTAVLCVQGSNPNDVISV